MLLDAGWASLLHATLAVALRRPARFMRTAFVALTAGFASSRGVARHLVYVAEACLLLRWLARDGIHHVHAHFGTNATMVAMLCHALGGPTYSFTVHGPEEFDDPSGLALRAKIEQAAFVAAITNYARSQLYRHCAFRSWSKIKIVRCGVDAQFLGPDPVPLGPSRRLLSIGRLCEQKGQLLLLEAAAILQREGRDMDLVLIGDGEMRTDLERVIARHALVEKVHMLGWANTDAIRAALDASCALVLPSFAEGLPVVIMEAFARGRPVLSTFVAGIPELVIPGRNGWLVPAGSVEALAQAMREVLDTPHERLQAMGLCGREDVRRRHDIDLIARDMAGHLKEALAAERTAGQAEAE